MMKISNSLVRIIDGDVHIDKLILINNFFVDDNIDSMKTVDIIVGTIECLIIKNIRKYWSNEYWRLIDKVVSRGGIIVMYNMIFVNFNCSRIDNIKINESIMIGYEVRDSNIKLLNEKSNNNHYYTSELVLCDGKYSGIGYCKYGEFIKNGFGKLEYCNGDVYEGGWQCNKRWGNGNITNSKHISFKSMCNKHLLDSMYVLMFLNNSSYEGEWYNDEKFGKGIMKWGEYFIYEGEMKNNKRNGYGIMKWDNYSVYEGEWKNDKRNGYGIIHKDNYSVYEGEWKNDKRNGYGIIHKDNYSVYEGEWKNDERNGYGFMEWDDGSSYEGEWYDDTRECEGIMKYNDGSVYEGEWLKNMRHGKGKIIYSDGGVYEGKWLKNMRHGKGKIIYSDGSIYKGVWKKDKCCFKLDEPYQNVYINGKILNTVNYNINAIKFE